MAVRIKRIYESASESDGFRVLVDRIWPRGISRAHAQLDLWQKDVAPSTQLRRWFGHKPERWQEFRKRYRVELKANPVLADLRKLSRQRSITLLYAAHDQEHNHALVLQAALGPSKRRKPARATPGKSRTRRDP